MLDVYFTPQADLDFADALDYYSRHSVTAAERFEEAIADSLRIIQRDPLVWAKVNARHHRYGIHAFPYSVYYRVTSTYILIVAIAHGARRPDYWQE